MALEIQNICKKYDNHDALKNISFSLKKGDIVGFLGPNGASQFQISFLLQFKFSALISLSLRELISFYLDEEVFVKWPNDIIVDNRKIAGCIIENVAVEQKIKTSVIGIGININQLKFKKYVPEATSLAKIKNCKFDINQIKNKLLQLIEEFYLKIDDDIVKVYNKYLFKKNKSFDYMINEKKDEGVIVSVNNQGDLLIRKNKKVKKVKVNQIKYLFQIFLII